MVTWQMTSRDPKCYPSDSLACCFLSPTAKRLDVSYRSIHQMTPFQSRMCLLGEKNLNLIFNLFIRKNRENTIRKILWGNVKDSLDCKNSGCMHGRVVIFGSLLYGIQGSANLTAFFKFTPGWPCCHGNEIWDKFETVGNNSACIGEYLRDPYVW